MRKVKFSKIRSTFGIVSRKTKKIYFIQFSLKEPWLFPKREKHYKPNELDANIYGWLFFYFGTMPAIIKNAKGD